MSAAKLLQKVEHFTIFVFNFNNLWQMHNLALYFHHPSFPQQWLVHKQLLFIIYFESFS